jgi:hypothetical protein
MDLKALERFSEYDQLDINLVRLCYIKANSLAPEITKPNGNQHIRESAFNKQ